VTDGDWFNFLSARTPDEVNFWQPSAERRAVRLETGAPFLFKLHSPRNYIVGGGFYIRYSALPARSAWEAFEEKNGAADYQTLRLRVERYRKSRISGDPTIGCHILNAPFFFKESDWIPVPESWSRNTQQGRTFETNQTDGLRLWNEVEGRLPSVALASLVAAQTPRYGAEYLTRARLGQGAFRVLVTESYGRRCAITGERTLPVLEAAHIRPYADSGPHLINNGILLRSDLHTLFDAGYLTLTEKYHIEVSKKIREEYENGKDYYLFHGRPVKNLPAVDAERPAPEFLRWHNVEKYLG
jgi:putative restriction endonuclease